MEIISEHPKSTLSFIVFVAICTLFFQSLLSDNEARCEEKCNLKNKKYNYTPPSINSHEEYVKELCKCV